MKKSILYRSLAKLGVIQFLARKSRARVGKESCPGSIAAFDLDTSISDPTGFYNSCVAYFDQHLATGIKEHRHYFSQEQRGFGEDAFHVMWSILVERFKPETFLEIGVYRGQVLSLVALLQRNTGISGKNMGIGPFERIGDLASVKDYGHCTDWLADIRANIAHFGLPEPRLVKALSTDPDAVQAIRSTAWDMIYIDGNHDYEVVREDWNHCAPSVKVGGVIILDDSALDSGYLPPLFASAGFPGPSRIANSMDPQQFKEVLRVGHNRAFQRLK